MMDSYFISEKHIINLEKIVGAEASLTYQYEEIEEVTIHYWGTEIVLSGKNAEKFWNAYRSFAKAGIGAD